MINLTPKTQISLECAINGKVVNLTFDIEDVNFQVGLQKISNLATELGQEYKTAQDTKTLESKKNKICKKIQTEFANISPEFKKNINGVQIKAIPVWIELLQQITAETLKLEKENSVIAYIQEEDSEGLSV